MRKRLREDVFSDNNLDNQWLQNQFDKFNHQYFENSLSLPYRLEFTDLGNSIGLIKLSNNKRKLFLSFLFCIKIISIF